MSSCPPPPPPRKKKTNNKKPPQVLVSGQMRGLLIKKRIEPYLGGSLDCGHCWFKSTGSKINGFFDKQIVGEYTPRLHYSNDGSLEEMLPVFQDRVLRTLCLLVRVREHMMTLVCLTFIQFNPDHHRSSVESSQPTCAVSFCMALVIFTRFFLFRYFSFKVNTLSSVDPGQSEVTP